ncbi:MocR-like pyridoxine biosynthesis transcription factor PdxR [Rugamonas apoptosis]|uniref:PLP-dependent aminotransferase family protein n=1 Tax=Rugamonas apoptosis TaxID=2758570 RepID=A0A7W2FCG9_9BURK|nr:PLP-dependent aminotransferase family protein [Rugamonas apoptosis]MBA5689069.1 PLP-dependent aminotransferase family protein [Rugamonas apoptosis]
MPRRQLLIEIPALGAIDRARGRIGRQLAEALRSAISRGELAAGEQLPSTRALAESLGVSRGTVTEAYEQLMAEGCLDAQPGASTRVAATLHAPNSADQRSAVIDADCAPSPPKSAARYAAIAERMAPLPSVPFSVAVPEGAVAMDDHWRRLSNRVRASQVAAPSGYSDPRGLLTLREAIAAYLRKARAVRCGPENIIITEGTQQGLYLAARVLMSPGDAAWAEDPAYPGLTSVLEERGIAMQRIAVDSQGFDVARALEMCPAAKAAFVTPSHQYPMGMPLSMPRRLALMEWAKQSGGWIVEDDYDSELRYAGQPFPALQGLDSRRVVYLGTFSKVLAPSLRLGYVVAPDCLAPAFAGARALMGRGSPLTEQHVIAAYMKEGYFETHIRRIRAIYGERRQALMDALQVELPELRIQPADQGMHIIVWLPDELNDVAVAKAANKAGVALRALSPMCSDNLPLSGLMLGFGGFTNEQLRDAVRRLRQVLEKGFQVRPPPGCTLIAE